MIKNYLSLVLLFTMALQAEVINVSSSTDFFNKIKNKNVVIKFGTEWCPSCKTSAKPFETISNEAEFKDILFLKVDADQLESVSNTYNVKTLPTLVYIKDGKEVARQTEMFKAENVKRTLRQFFAQSNNQTKKEEVKQVTNNIQETATMPTVKQNWWEKTKSVITENFTWIKNKIASLFNRS